MILTLGLFIEYLLDPNGQLYFVCVVASVVFSITLHELAHGYAAIRLGDRTPESAGHMTMNPFVHMGAFSIFVLMMIGLAWGAMPIDPTRMRGKYAEAIVAAAGPATNLVLGVLGLTIVGVWVGLSGAEGVSGGEPVENFRYFFLVFGATNIALCVFNLLPAPPLDGSHILANFHRGYARLIDNPSNQGLRLVMFIAAFWFGRVLIDPAVGWAYRYVEWLGGLF